METYSSGGGRRKHYVSKTEIENLKKGGIKAQQIKAKSDAHHLNTEIPNAEKILQENIDTAFNAKDSPNTNNTNTKSNTSEQLENLKTNISYSQKNFFQKIIEKIINFINRIFFAPNK